MLQVRGRKLLLGVGPGFLRAAVAFHHQAVQAQVHGPLGQFLQVFAVAGHVGRIGKERHLRIPGAQLDGNLPAGVVAVRDAGRCRKAAVNHPQLAQAGAVQALQCTDPQVQVRIHGILHQHGHVRPFQGIGNLLHQERVGRCTRAHPHHIHTVLDALQYVLLGSNLRADVHTQLLLDAAHPLEALRTHALEGTRVRTRLPNAGTEYVNAEFTQALGRSKQLLLGLCAAGTRNAHRTGQGEKSPFRRWDDI